MLKDPIIEELHKIREDIAAEFNYDLHAIVQSLHRSQREANRQFVTLPPKLVIAAAEPGDQIKETLSVTHSAS